MIATQDIDRIIGCEAVDPQNDKIGKVSQVYIDQETEQPSWVSVRTGLFGTSESLVPLQNANWDSEALHVGYAKDRIKDAPRVEADRELSPEEQEELYRYYGMNDGTTGATGTTGTGTAGYEDTVGTGTAGYEDTVGTGTAGYEGAVGRDTAGYEGAVGRDTSGPNTDAAMTRSEERLNVGTRTVQTGRARLRKHVVTEQRDVTVPVTREEVRVEREPITDANRGAAYDGPDLSDEEHEVTLTEERPVVEKETVPVERVRLTKEQVADERRVSADVRREEIGMEGDGETGRTA